MVRCSSVCTPLIPATERPEIFQPDFSVDNEIYKLGFNNDVDLALQKPKYRDIVNARLQQIDVPSHPHVSDADLIESLVPRYMDTNELASFAKQQLKECFKK